MHDSEQSRYEQLPRWSTPEPAEGGLLSPDFRLLLSARPRWLRPTVKTPPWLWRLLPWCLTVFCGKTSRRLPKVTSTSYLNGIRGIACLVVLSYHIQLWYDHQKGNPYGAEPVEQNSYIMQLPILRLVYAGRAMVCIFFILSGFVLSFSSLRKMQTLLSPNSPSSAGDLITGLCSSTLRRFIRLFGPMMVAAFLTSFVIWLYPDSFSGQWREESTQLTDVMKSVMLRTEPFLNPFTWDNDYRPIGMVHFWTLAAEYRGSMVVFLLCIMVSKMTTVARKLFVSMFALWALYWWRMDICCFTLGVLLAELRHNPLSADLPVAVAKIKVPMWLSCGFYWILFVSSLFILSWPDMGDQGFEPYATMSSITPDRWKNKDELTSWFYGTVGAFCLLFAVENLPSVQKVLSTGPMIYFGEISFSFYLLHWIGYCSVGEITRQYLQDTLGVSARNAYSAMVSVSLVVLIFAADIYWRTVDENSVRLSKFMVDCMGIHQKPQELPVTLRDQGDSRDIIKRE
ncbi:acyltransferase family-domain-containing protein [Xylariales sp. PMI_506]|nr:acyltransferase family-domain-containing protein [Xylariales sp. PMI_506]